MHGWAAPSIRLASNRLDFRQFRLLLALEQGASGSARSFAKAGSNLAALIPDERAFVDQRTRKGHDPLDLLCFEIARGLLRCLQVCPRIAYVEDEVLAFFEPSSLRPSRTPLRACS